MQVKVATFGLGVCVGLVASKVYLKRTVSVEVRQREPQRSVESSLAGHLFKFGAPQPPYSSHLYSSHAVLYDHQRRVPIWSAELITRDKIRGEAKRSRSRFQPDPAVPLKYSSNNEDYRGSGWSRGHMTPAADCKHSQGAMDDSFYLTNIVPQDIDNNSGYWNRLEMYCRDLTKIYSTVCVISGPLFLPTPKKNTIEDDKKGSGYVSYEVIGENSVAVPTHLFKIILAEKGTTSPLTASQSTLTPSHSHLLTLGAFVIPNRQLGDEELSQFQVSLEDLEGLSGVTFHPQLDRTAAGDLCITNTCKLMTSKEFKQRICNRRLGSTVAPAQQDQSLHESQEGGVAPDVTMATTETERKSHLIGRQ